MDSPKNIMKHLFEETEVDEYCWLCGKVLSAAELQGDSGLCDKCFPPTGKEGSAI